MGFFVKKRRVLAPKPKISRQKNQLWNSKLFQLNSSWILHPRHKKHKGGRERGDKEEGHMNQSAEACSTIESCDPKHLWKRMCMQAAREAHFAWSESLTDTPEVVH